VECANQAIQALVRSRHHPDEHAQKLSACTRGIVFMGTPHAGVDQLVEWARLLALSLGVLKQTNTEILQVLRRDSELLYRIQNEFHTMIRDKKKRGETDIELCCFFEELPLRGIGLVSSGSTNSDVTHKLNLKLDRSSPKSPHIFLATTLAESTTIIAT
jgi:hypothetical protein